MSDPVTRALAQIAERRRSSFVIVSDTSRENLFAQFIASDEEPGLYGELVGNEYLPEGERLTPAQQDELRARGWEGDGTGNWARSWPRARTEADFQAIALEALQALRDVYGAQGDVDVEVELVDEDDLLDEEERFGEDGRPDDGRPDAAAAAPGQAPTPERSLLMLALIVALLGVLAAVILARGA